MIFEKSKGFTFHAKNYTDDSRIFLRSAFHAFFFIKNNYIRKFVITLLKIVMKKFVIFIRKIVSIMTKSEILTTH